MNLDYIKSQEKRLRKAADLLRTISIKMEVCAENPQLKATHVATMKQVDRLIIDYEILMNEINEKPRQDVVTLAEAFYC